MLLRGRWKGRQSLGVQPRTPGLCTQCSVTELWRLDNHQPSQSSTCTAQQVGLKWLSHTPDSLSACGTPFTGGWLVKFSQSGGKPCWVFFSVQMLRTLVLCRILEVKIEESEKVMLAFTLSASIIFPKARVLSKRTLMLKTGSYQPQICLSN